MAGRKIRLSLTGDTMIARNLSEFPYCNDVAKIIRSADVRFTNCECLFHKGDIYPMPRGESAATLWYAEPSLAKESILVRFQSRIDRKYSRERFWSCRLDVHH